MPKETKKLLLYVVGAICFIIVFNYLINNLSSFPSMINSIISIFTPFLLGGIFAFIINVPMRKIEKYLKQWSLLKKWSDKTIRLVSLLMSLLLIFGIISFVLFLLVPSLVNALYDLAKSLPGTVESLANQLSALFVKYPDVVKQIDTIQSQGLELIGSILKTVTSQAGNILSNTVAVLSSTIAALLNVFIGFIFSIYILLGKEKWIYQFKKVLFAFLDEKTANYIIDLFTLSNHTFSNYLTGQLFEGVLNCTFAFVGCIIFGLPYAPVVAVLVGVMAMIPYFGTTIGMSISALLIASVSLPKALLFVGYELVMQQIDGNIIYPRVVGEQMGLPAIWVMLAAITGMNVAGVVGMVIFVPVTSMIYALIVMFVNRRLESRQIDVSKIKPRTLGNLFPKKDGSSDNHTI